MKLSTSLWLICSHFSLNGLLEPVENTEGGKTNFDMLPPPPQPLDQSSPITNSILLVCLLDNQKVWFMCFGYGCTYRWCCVEPVSFVSVVLARLHTVCLFVTCQMSSMQIQTYKNRSVSVPSQGAKSFKWVLPPPGMGI